MEFSADNRIFPIPEIECVILEYLNTEELFSLMYLNKFYCRSIYANSLYDELNRFRVIVPNYHIRGHIWSNIVLAQGKNQFCYVYKFIIACGTGYLGVAKYYHSQCLSTIPFSDIFNDNLFPTICMNGHTNIVEWLLPIYHKQITSDVYDLVLRFSCRHGKLEIIKMICSVNKLNIRVNNDYAFRTSCEFGHLDVAKYLISLDDGINIHSDDEYAFRMSCKHGHMKVCRYLISLKSNNKINIHAEEEDAFRKSCENGHINIVKWLYSLAHEMPNYSDSMSRMTNRIWDCKINIHAKNRYAFRQSCYYGHLDIVKYLISKTNTEVDLYESIKSGCEEASANGHIRIVKYLLSKNIKFDLRDSFNRSCQNNRLKLVRYFVLKKGYHLSKSLNDWWIFKICCTKNYTELVRFLLSSFNESERDYYETCIEMNCVEIFENCCAHGYVSMAKWIHEFITKRGHTMKISNFFDINLSYYVFPNPNHRFQIAKFIYSLNKQLPKHRHMNSLFIKCCINGNLKFAKWLYNLSVENGKKINIRSENDYAFRKSCSNGHLEIVKWLHSLPNSNINHLACGCEAFQQSCVNGHTRIAKWIKKTYKDKYYLHVFNNQIIDWKVL